MRFAASFSEDAFAEHMETKQGRVILTSLPSEDDSMYQKVRAIRVRDQLFVDQLQTDYEQFAAKIAPSYRLWQEQTLRISGPTAGQKRCRQSSCWRSADAGASHCRWVICI